MKHSKPLSAQPPATTAKLPTLYINEQLALPDKGVWQNRFKIHSSSSNRVYVVSQHKEDHYWGCSCPGWIHYRKCKHLDSVGLPGNKIPHLVNAIKQ